MRKFLAIGALFVTLLALVPLLFATRSGSDKNSLDDESTGESALVAAPTGQVKDDRAKPVAAPPQEEVSSDFEPVMREPTPIGSNRVPLDPFFVSEEDYIEVATFWSGQYRRNGDEWITHLESELTRTDQELNSRDLEDLAISAVLSDPGYTYDPPLAAEVLRPVCSNLVCKVQIPSNVMVAQNFSAIQLVPGSRLNTYSYVMFTHGFGYHLVHNQPIENTTTHYFLANGYEM